MNSNQPKPLYFYADEDLIAPDNPLSVLVIGAGGTGGEVLDGLTRLNAGLRAFGHPGIQVTCFEGNVFREANIGRQRCNLHDVGVNKGIAIINKINLFYGLNWEAIPRHFVPENDLTHHYYDVIVTCVDKARVRADIGLMGMNHGGECRTLWLDHGNTATQGQVILGHLSSRPPGQLTLPNVFHFYPELVDSEQFDENDTPSCSLAEALEQQSPYINRVISDCGMTILWQLLKYGKINQHGANIDLNSLSVSPLYIDPVSWQMYGVEPDPTLYAESG